MKPNPSVLRAVLTKEAAERRKAGKESSLTEEVIQTIVNKMDALNMEIEKHPLLGADFKIGHTYFFEVAKYAADDTRNNIFTRLWNNKLQSLLEEYLRGLGNQDTIQRQIKTWKDLFCKV